MAQSFFLCFYIYNPTAFELFRGAGSIPIGFCIGPQKAYKLLYHVNLVDRSRIHIAAYKQLYHVKLNLIEASRINKRV